MNDSDPLDASQRPALSLEWQEHAEFLRRLARGLLFDAGRVEDALQEAWLVARRHPGASRGWLVGVVRKVSSQMRRGEGRRLVREAIAARAEALPAASESLERLELTSKLVERVRALDEPYRTLILLRYFDDLSANEIARRRNLPLATVRTQLRRGLQRLRESLLAEENSTPEAWLSALMPLVGPIALAPLPNSSGASPGPITGAPTAWTASPLIQTAVMSTSFKLAGVLLIVVGGAFVGWRTLSGGELEPETTELSTSDFTSGGLPQAASDESVAGRALPDSEQNAVRRAAETAPTSANSAETWRVYGTVMRSSAGVYPNAKVRVRLWAGYEAEGEPTIERELTCDGSGKFELLLAPPQTTVTLRAGFVGDGHFKYNEGDLVARGESPSALVITAYPLDGALVGRVHLADGTPVAGAQVTGPGASVETDEAGRYRLPTTSSIMLNYVSARSPGFTSKRLVVGELRAAAERSWDIELAPAVSVRGRVTDEAGRALAGVKVRTFFGIHGDVLTNEQGEYLLEGLDADRDDHMLAASLEGYVMAQATLPLSAGSPAEHDFVLQRGVQVHGFVVDEVNKPVPAAQLYIGFDPSAVNRVDAVAIDDGSFLFPSVEGGSQTLVVQRKGFAPHSEILDLPTDGSAFAELRIVLGPAHFIAGRVVDATGAARSGVAVSMRYRDDYIDGRTHTDEHGRFRFEGLPASELSAEFYGTGILRRVVPIDAVDRDDLEFVVEAAGRLQARVIDAVTRESVTEFRVRFVEPNLRPGERSLGGYSATWSREGMFFSDSDGRFDTAGAAFERGCVIGLEVAAAGYATGYERHAVVRAAGEEDDLVIELVRGTTLRGTLVDASDGRVVSGARVRLYPEGTNLHSLYDGDPHGPAVIYSDGQGAFLIEHVPAGEVLLVIEHADYPKFVDGPIEIALDALELRRDIALPSGAQLVGQLLTLAGAPHAGEEIQLRVAGSRTTVSQTWQTTTDADGQFRFERLPAGTFEVAHVVKRGQQSLQVLAQSIQLDAKGQREVELRARGTSSWSGHLVCEEGLPKLCGVRLNLWEHADGKPALSGTGRTYGVFVAGEERFHLSGIEAGTYRVILFYTNFTSGESWRTEDRELELRFEAGQALQQDLVLRKSQR